MDYIQQCALKERLTKLRQLEKIVKVQRELISVRTAQYEEVQQKLGQREIEKRRSEANKRKQKLDVVHRAAPVSSVIAKSSFYDTVAAEYLDIRKGVGRRKPEKQQQPDTRKAPQSPVVGIQFINSEMECQLPATEKTFETFRKRYEKLSEEKTIAQAACEIERLPTLADIKSIATRRFERVVRCYKSMGSNKLKVAQYENSHEEFQQFKADAPSGPVRSFDSDNYQSYPFLRPNLESSNSELSAELILSPKVKSRPSSVVTNSSSAPDDRIEQPTFANSNPKSIAQSLLPDQTLWLRPARKRWGNLGITDNKAVRFPSPLLLGTPVSVCQISRQKYWSPKAAKFESALNLESPVK